MFRFAKMFDLKQVGSCMVHGKIFRFAKMFDLKQVRSCMVTSKTSVELLNKGMNCVAFAMQY
jgi:hypothetical protein